MCLDDKTPLLYEVVYSVQKVILESWIKKQMGQGVLSSHR